MVDIFNDLVRTLMKEAAGVLRKGMTRTYEDQEDNLTAVRGKISIRDDIRLNVAVHAKIYCRFSEFTPNTVENRILKWTLYHLMWKRKLSSKTYAQCHFYMLQLHDVPLVEVSHTNFPRLSYTRLNRHYRKSMNLCRLILHGPRKQIVLKRGIQW